MGFCASEGTAKRCERCGNPFKLRGSLAPCGRYRRLDGDPCGVCRVAGRSFCVDCCEFDALSVASLEREVAQVEAVVGDLQDALVRLSQHEDWRVYFIRSGDGSIKIGTSANVQRRLAALQSANPTRLELIGDVAGGHALERQLHVELAVDRLHGEWFRASPLVLRTVERAIAADKEPPFGAAMSAALVAQAIETRRVIAMRRRRLQ